LCLDGAKGPLDGFGAALSPQPLELQELLGGDGRQQRQVFLFAADLAVTQKGVRDGMEDKKRKKVRKLERKKARKKKQDTTK
jgi:hypothetical protein